MLPALIRRSVVGLLLALAASCTDSTAPSRLQPAPALRDIDISVATVALDLTYHGQSIGSPMTPVVQGDRCFSLFIDGQRDMMGACGSREIRDLAPGTHTIALRQYMPAGPPPAMGSDVDVQPPVTVTLTGGTTTPVSFELATVRGQIAGNVRINGQLPPDYQYQVCIEAGGCGGLVGGRFALFARPGTGQIYLQSFGAGRIAERPYTVVAGETTDLGAIEVEFATVALDLTYHGQSIGSPMTPVVQGDRCFSLFIDGQRDMMGACGSREIRDLAPGTHTIALRQYMPAGPPPAMGSDVDVQPPVTVTLTGGTTTPVSFELATVRGQIAGNVRINGQLPPDYQYQVCIEAGGCGGLVGGRFALFARPGTGQIYLQSFGAGRIAERPYTVVAGETTDLGAIEVEFATVALDLTYHGQSIGSPMTPVVQGDRCFSLFIDGQRDMMGACGSREIRDLAPGTHTIALRQYMPAGPPPAMGSDVDVQPPVTVTLTGGTTTPVSFELATVRGQIAGNVRINGQVPPDYQYQVCIEAGGCGGLVGGRFALFARPGPGRAFLRSTMQFSSLAQFSYIVAAGRTTLITGISTDAPGSTPVGTSVPVQPVNQTDGSSNATVDMTFENVTTAGTTTVQQSASGPPAPAGFQFGQPPVFFDISTSATFSGDVEVCINYTGTTFAEGATIELLHADARGNWLPVTTSHDATTRIICGSVTSFSPFIVASRPAAPPAPPPSVSATVDGTLGTGGWYTTDVAVRWAISGNGIPITSSAGCAERTITDDNAGETIACTAVSAGGTTREAVTVKRDATSPTVTFSGNAGEYAIDQMVSISCSATDAMSGIAHSTCRDTAAPAYEFATGTNGIAASATDHAGNQATTSASFIVTLSTDGLCALTARWTSSAGIANSLCAKLRAAHAARGRGNAGAARNQIEAYANEVSAQSGKSIAPAHAAILLRLANEM